MHLRRIPSSGTLMGGHLNNPGMHHLTQGGESGFNLPMRCEQQATIKVIHLPDPDHVDQLLLGHVNDECRQ